MLFAAVGGCPYSRRLLHQRFLRLPPYLTLRSEPVSTLRVRFERLPVRCTLRVMLPVNVRCVLGEPVMAGGGFGIPPSTCWTKNG
jgi:hypothetical protein